MKIAEETKEVVVLNKKDIMSEQKNKVETDMDKLKRLEEEEKKNTDPDEQMKGVLQLTCDELNESTEQNVVG
jgi:hypothetical protein